MKIIAVIPARMASTRFPGKPMVDVLGMPMIGHCYKELRCVKIDFVYVATCDKEIFNYMCIIGNVVMISSKHKEHVISAEAIKIEKIHKNRYFNDAR